MEASPAVSGVVVVALVAALAALVAAVVALQGQRRVRRAYRAFSGRSRDDVLTLIERHIDEVRLLRGEVRELRRFGDQLRELDTRAVSRVGLVRYDAFEELGGHLSFSTALLTERGDGIVVSAINGRTDTRIYAKPVEAWRSRHNLSDEESTAITRARRGVPLSEQSAASSSGEVADRATMDAP